MAYIAHITLEWDLRSGRWIGQYLDLHNKKKEQIIIIHYSWRHEKNYQRTTNPAMQVV